MRQTGEHIDLLHEIPILQQKGTVILLESQSDLHPAAQKSYLAACPVAEFRAYGDHVICNYGNETVEKSGVNPWEECQKFYNHIGDWLFGYFGYDLKNKLEQLQSANPDRVGAPDLYMMQPGLLLEIRPEGCKAIKGKLCDHTPSDRGRLSSIEFEVERFRPQISKAAYHTMIEKAKTGIREGEYYEINLSHQMKGSFCGSPFGLYQAMKKAGPVPFGAYLHLEESGENMQVCCASPERFLARRGARVFSQPIKGTIHRGTYQEEDQRLKKWLQKSEKNRAENLMIVDLVRNDLGRIARKGSVKVVDLFQIQTFETVHQMVSTVEARVEEAHPVEIIKACFPMGSMTGAPKISAMQAIEQLEKYRRGIYSGAVGYLCPEGNFDFNVVIRSAIIKDDDLFYSVGGAITSDSVAEKEWDETLVKAEALHRAFQQKVRAGEDSGSVS